MSRMHYRAPAGTDRYTLCGRRSAAMAYTNDLAAIDCQKCRERLTRQHATGQDAGKVNT